MWKLIHVRLHCRKVMDRCTGTACCRLRSLPERTSIFKRVLKFLLTKTTYELLKYTDLGSLCEYGVETTYEFA